jgi:hypothetical protein
MWRALTQVYKYGVIMTGKMDIVDFFKHLTMNAYREVEV